MSDKIKIKKGSVQETLIIPLFARKLCCERFSSLYNDRTAVEVCNRPEYDFSDLEKKSKNIFYEFGALEGAMRQSDVSEYFRTNNPKQELSLWSEQIDVSVRGYMRGYYDMKNPEVSGFHR